MSKAIESKPIVHAHLPGVQVYPFGAQVQRGMPQEVLVIVEPHAVIPLHSHETDAHMFVVSGEAVLLSDDQELNGSAVETGTVVFFEKEINHGFRAGSNGLRFMSRNGGIVDSTGAWDMKVAGV